MTTLAELCLQPPAPTHGKPLQFEYGVGDMMLAFEVADISAGASIEWHDLSQFFEMARWRVGAEQAYGKYRDGNPVVLLRRRFTDGVADFDALAPWYEDTSAVFGSHVRLRGGLIARLGIFRVADGATDKWFPLFTSRVKRWSDGARAMGNNRYHQITCMGMQSRLARKPLSSRLPEGWRPRLDADLTQAAWNLPVEVYGAETEDDGGGAVPTVKLAARPALTSAIQALDSTLDPVGLTWRILPNGTLLVEPAPWTTFHADKFADAGLTVTGAVRLNPLLGIYPGGRVTFSWSPADEPGQVGFYNYPTDGDGFGIDSDVENVVNEWQITYPLDVDDEGAGTDSRNYQDPVSADEFDPAPMQAATWLARNDKVQEDTVDFRAHADLVTPPLLTSIDAPGAFPALAVLGQYDPITVVNATREDRTQVSANGIIRSITHEMRAGKLGTGVTWKAWVQPDLQSSEQTPLLKPVNALQVTDVREDGATFSWVDPSQAIAPTETQVRMNSGAWLSIAYPAGGFDWFTGLAPKTLHKFEVRLVRKVDDLTTHVSPVREVSFTTLEVTVPTVPPGGDGTVVVVPPPDEECDAVWELLRSSDGIVYELVASGDKDDFTYDEETDTWLLDNSDYTFEEGYTYRRRVREICGGVPGDWVYETPTSIVCEDPAQLGSDPYDEASLKVFVPKICGTKVLEAVTGVEGTKGPAFGGIGLDNAGNYALKSATGVGGIVAYGAAGIDELTGDLSKAITVNLGTVPASGSPVALWQCAGLHIEAHYVSASTWRVRAKIFLASGGSITTTFSGALNLDTEYEIFVEHDVENETVSVKVDDTEVGTGTAGARVNALPVWIMGLPADSYATSAAVWSSVVGSGGGTAHGRVAALVATLSGVELYAKMDDAAPSGTCVDSSGNGRNGTYTGHEDIEPVAAGPDDDSLVASFPVSDAARVGIPDYAAWDSILAAFCVINRVGGTYGTIIDRDEEGNGNVNRAWQFRINHTNNKLEFVRTGASAVTIASSTTIPLGVEHTVGWWRNASTGVLTLYIDGAAVGTGSPGALNSTGASPITLANHKGQSGNPNIYSQPYGGLLGSVVLLSSADATTIPALHAAWANT